MRILQLESLERDMFRAAKAFSPAVRTKNTKLQLFTTLEKLQGISLNPPHRGYKIDFSNSEVLDFLLEHNVLTAEDAGRDSFIEEGRHLALRDQMEKARKIVNEADPEMLRQIDLLIARFCVYRFKNPLIDGGSVSGCIGMVYLSPDLQWTTIFYAEMMVHEYVHNRLFLEDMVYGIFPDLLALKRDDAKVISAIRGTKREYDKSFHAAFVASALCYFYHRLGEADKARSFIEPLRKTLLELNEVDELLLRKDVCILTPHARELKLELLDFVADFDHDRLH